MWTAPCKPWTSISKYVINIKMNDQKGKMKERIISLCAITMLFPLFACGQIPEPAKDPDAGFTPILTQETFDNWEGQSEYWRFEDGVLIGEVTEDNLLTENTFLVWQGGTLENFALKVEFRISSDGNSGINYRSETVGGQKYVLRGYQADIDGPNQWSGQVYEEKGRTFLALRGQITHVGKDDKPNVIGSLGDKTKLASVIDKGQWNTLQIIARDNVIIHLINGRVMSIVIDDGKKQAEEGLLGLQLHQGRVMKVEYRDLRIKQF